MLRDLHVVTAWVVVLGNAAAGCWALAAHRYEELRTRALWWFTAAAQVTVFVQAAVGAGLAAADDVAVPPMHALYGFSGLFAVAIIHGYRQDLAARRHLLYGFGGLFISGLGIRAMFLS